MPAISSKTIINIIESYSNGVLNKINILGNGSHLIPRSFNVIYDNITDHFYDLSESEGDTTYKSAFNELIEHKCSTDINETNEEFKKNNEDLTKIIITFNFLEALYNKDKATSTITNIINESKKIKEHYHKAKFNIISSLSSKKIPQALIKHYFINSITDAAYTSILKETKFMDIINDYYNSIDEDLIDSLFNDYYSDSDEDPEDEIRLEMEEDAADAYDAYEAYEDAHDLLYEGYEDEEKFNPHRTFEEDKEMEEDFDLGFLEYMAEDVIDDPIPMRRQNGMTEDELDAEIQRLYLDITS